MTTIGQVMNARVNAIADDATVAEAVEFLTRHHTGSAPVVNKDGELVGMISELALIDVVFDPAFKDAPMMHFMTADVHAVGSDEPLSRAAQLFALYAFRRLPVVENGKLIGVFTRRDLMNYVLSTGNFLVDPLMTVFPSLAAGGVADTLHAEMQDVA